MKTSVPSRRSIMIAATVIFAFAITLRVPSCYESFWLDELHSAWCVWDSLSDVFPRANLGHQSPFYFVGLWFWKQVAGGSELALRMSSVLAVAASSVVLTVGVARWTKSLAAGATAGSVMAMESNSLFFGTELRPYAFVILFSSFAIVYFLRLVAVDSRCEDRPAWIGIIVATLLAVLCQPTAIGVLAWLPIALFFVWLVRTPRELLKLNLSDGFLILTAAAVGFALWRVTLGETWQQRANWSSFATATRVGQIWEVWDWTWMLIVPLGFVLVASIVPAMRHQTTPVSHVVLATVLLSLIAVLATCFYWVLSRGEWMPVWHRRYFVAVLPILTCIVGGAVGAVTLAMGSSRKALATGCLVALTLVFWPAHQRVMMTKLIRYPVALVSRGENWRDAVQWVRARAASNDLILLDAGLVEANAWLPPGAAAVQTIQAYRGPSRHSMASRREYLAFPAKGPYSLDRDVVPIRYNSLGFQSNLADRRIYWITRRAPNQVNVSLPLGSQIAGFGNVTVIRQSSKLDRGF